MSHRKRSLASVHAMQAEILRDVLGVVGVVSHWHRMGRRGAGEHDIYSSPFRSSNLNHQKPSDRAASKPRTPALTGELLIMTGYSDSG